MNSVARTVSDAADRLLRQRRPRERHADYAFCAEDGYWFRPAYTDGKCPLCGKFAVGGAPPVPRFARLDRSWYGWGALALESIGMLVLVLFMYFKG